MITHKSAEETTEDVSRDCLPQWAQDSQCVEEFLTASALPLFAQVARL